MVTWACLCGRHRNCGGLALRADEAGVDVVECECMCHPLERLVTEGRVEQ